MLTMPLARAILHELSTRGPLLRTEIARALDVAPNSVIAHLKGLEESGLIVADIPVGERAGRRVHYSINAAGVVEVVDTLLAYVLADNDYRVAHYGDPGSRQQAADD